MALMALTALMVTHGTEIKSPLNFAFIRFSFFPEKPLAVR